MFVPVQDLHHQGARDGNVPNGEQPTSYHVKRRVVPTQFVHNRNSWDKNGSAGPLTD